jgi:hypothetical protein
MILKQYIADVKDIKRHSQWWKKHESMFSSIGFLVCQILNVVGSLIKIYI